MPDISSGVLVFELGGRIVEVEGTFSVQPSRTKREAVVGESGKVYTRTMPEIPTIKGDVLVTEDVTAAWYSSLDGVRGSCRLRDGRSYSFSGLTSVGTFEHDVIGGKVSIECFAAEIVEKVA